MSVENAELSVHGKISTGSDKKQNLLDIAKTVLFVSVKAELFVSEKAELFVSEKAELFVSEKTVLFVSEKKYCLES